jgi:hypothetical protein
MKRTSITMLLAGAAAMLPPLLSSAAVSKVALSDYPYEVIYPNGGETFAVGETVTVVTASSAAGSVTALRIKIERSEYPLPGLNEQFNPVVDPEHSFVIPATFTERVWTDTGVVTLTVSSVSDECLIQLFNYSMPEEYDESDGFFSIIATPIVFTSDPTGLYAHGDTLRITWRAADRITGCYVEISTDAGQTWARLTQIAITRADSQWGDLAQIVGEDFADTLVSASDTCFVRLVSDDGSYSVTSGGTSAVVEPAGRGNRGAAAGPTGGVVTYRTVSKADLAKVVSDAGSRGNRAIVYSLSGAVLWRGAPASTCRRPSALGLLGAAAFIVEIRQISGP